MNTEKTASRISDLEREIELLREREARLSHAYAKLDSIVNTLQDVIYRLDTDGKIVFLNDAIRVYGYDPHRLIGCEIMSLIHPDDREAARFRINARRTGNRRTRSLEIRLLLGDQNQTGCPAGGNGEYRIFLFHAEGMYSSDTPNEQTFAGTQGIARDITDQKLTELISRENKARLDSIIKTAPLGIIMLDRDRVIQWASDLLAEMTGYQPEELTGVRLHTLFENPAEYEHAAEILFNKMDRSGKGSVDCVMKRKDGTLIEIDLRGCYNLPPLTEIATLTVLDISTRKQAEREKERVMAQLSHAQKMEAIGTLAGGIAHDFNNILSGIIGYAELTMARMGMHDPSREFIQQILHAGKRATGLVRQILTLSRDQRQEMTAVNITPILKETIKLLRATLPTTIEISAEIATTQDLIVADPTQVHQVIMNLCTNAGFAMRERGGILTVGLDLVRPEPRLIDEHPELREGEYLRLSVSDTGVGILPEVMTKIFDPFFTTKKGEGSGLGLSVTQSIVHRHGGAITVESTPGRGTVFRVYLPREKTKPAQRKRTSISPLPRGNERILLVDDETTLVRMTQRMLEELGYHVITRTSSLEALELFKSQPYYFDLVITDYTMPHLTGADLAREMIAQRPDIPILLYTGYSELITPEKAPEYGIRELLFKPLVTRELAEAVRRALVPLSQMPHDRTDEISISTGTAAKKR